MCVGDGIDGLDRTGEQREDHHQHEKIAEGRREREEAGGNDQQAGGDQHQPAVDPV
ncbi:hypothetical protein D3C87_2183540 [compost metagenome]